MSLQARPEADIDAFFKHENQRESPSFSDRGKLRQGTKSDSIACLPGMPAPGRCKAVKEATVVILDMAAVIHIIKPQRVRIFGVYNHMQLLPYMQSQMTDNTSRVDAIWDTHKEASLKLQTHAKRVRLQVVEYESQPRYLSPSESNGRSSSKDNQNKDELFQFIGQELQRSTVDSTYHLLAIKADIVLSNKATDITALSPCQQEEADSRMMLHLRHAAMQGSH